MNKTAGDVDAWPQLHARSTVGFAQHRGTKLAPPCFPLVVCLFDIAAFGVFNDLLCWLSAWEDGKMLYLLCITSPVLTHLAHYRQLGLSCFLQLLACATAPACTNIVFNVLFFAE